MSTGNVLSDLLKKFNLNALELERMTGVPSSTIYRLLKNKGGNPTIDVLKKLSSFFQITVSQLIGEEPIGLTQVPLISPYDIYEFTHSNNLIKENIKSIPIDFPVSDKCFATVSQDSMMEPFILVNSIVIIDPKKEPSNKDFILLIENQKTLPKIRQVIFDGNDVYLKALNSNYSIELKKYKKNDYIFAGILIQYRTNLFNVENNQKEKDNTSQIYTTFKI